VRWAHGALDHVTKGSFGNSPPLCKESDLFQPTMWLSTWVKVPRALVAEKTDDRLCDQNQLARRARGAPG